MNIGQPSYYVVNVGEETNIVQSASEKRSAAVDRGTAAVRIKRSE